MTRSRALVSLACAVLAASCVTEDPTQLLVVLSTDMDVPEELDAARIMVIGPDSDDPVYDNVIPLNDPLQENGDWRVLASFGAVPEDGDPDREVTVKVTAVRDRMSLFTTMAITRYVPGQRMRLDIFIAEACQTLAEMCLPEETCGLEGCVDPYVPTDALTPAGETLDRPTDPRMPREEVRAPMGRSVGAGETMACGVDAGELWCWGDVFATTGSMTCSGHTPAAVEPAGEWVHVSVGRRFACGLRSDGTVWCWGENEGELGLGDEVPRDVPTQLTALPPVSWVDGGFNHACAVTVAGELYCWGLNIAGALGIPGATQELSPARVGTDADWAMVSAGLDVTCALKTDGSLYCWGNNTEGAVGTGAFTPTEIGSPTRVGDALYQHVDTYRTTCAIDVDSHLWCWGAADEGQLGNGGTAHQAEPISIDSARWRDVSTGRRQTCGVSVEGILTCWGAGAAAGEGAGSSTPALVDSTSSWMGVDTGVNVSCAVRSDGSVACWGRNDFCQVGVSTAGMTVSTPTDVLP